MLLFYFSVNNFFFVTHKKEKKTQNARNETMQNEENLSTREDFFSFKFWRMLNFVVRTVTNFQSVLQHL